MTKNTRQKTASQDYYNNYKYGNSTNNRNTNSNSTSNNNATMVACNVCQLYIPENESYMQNGIYYCTKEHANQK